MKWVRGTLIYTDPRCGRTLATQGKGNGCLQASLPWPVVTFMLYTNVECQVVIWLPFLGRVSSIAHQVWLHPRRGMTAPTMRLSDVGGIAIPSTEGGARLLARFAQGMILGGVSRFARYLDGDGVRITPHAFVPLKETLAMGL